MKVRYILSLVSAVSGFTIPSLHQRNLNAVHLRTFVQPFGKARNRCSVGYKRNDEDDRADEEEEMDWREFRARLVSTYDMPQKESQNNSQLNDHTWMYETGSTIETGSVLLHRVEDDCEDSGYALARQYLHKSVVLVLEHDNVGTTMTTKGVILNRPTDLILHEPATKRLKEVNFPIWFGGSTWGLHTENPKFFCLHSIKSIAAKRVSKKVMKGIYFTSVSIAKTLIADGLAKPHDFFFFGGYLEWENGELCEEIQDGLWHTVSTDAGIVKKGLKILTEQDVKDVKNAGVNTWAMMMELMHQYGNSKFKSTPKQCFDDKMLQEWAKTHLFFNEAPLFMRGSDNGEDDVSRFITAVSGNVLPGTLLRGSSNCCPFLLSDQEFHKSLILVVQDDQELSVGLILNQPSSKAYKISLRDESFFKSTYSMQLPIRYGGPYGGPSSMSEEDDDDDGPLFILHMSQALRDAKIGQPIGENFKDGIWSCTTKEYSSAIANYLASPDEFMCVDGFCMWTKHVTESGNVGGGIMEDVLEGKFEIVPHVRTHEAFNELLKQQLLRDETIDQNFEVFHSAWILADHNWRGDKEKETTSNEIKRKTLLNDEALKHWMSIYLNDD